MLNAAEEAGFATWGAEGLPFTVEYSRAALEALRTEVVDGFHKLPRGGLEVGGVLFGERNGNTVRILASRPLACEHAAGPSFLLSEKDEVALKQLVESAATDPGLAGMVAAGWYHSHTRSGVFLSEEDGGIWDRHFPESWQVSLVLHPEKLKPTRAGFFVREESGVTRTESSHLEFVVEPLRKKRKVVQPAPELAPRENVAASQAPAAVSRTTGRLSWFLFALAWCIAAGSLAFALRDYWLPKPSAPVNQQPTAGELDRLRADLDRETRRNRDLEAEIEALKEQLREGK